MIIRAILIRVARHTILHSRNLSKSSEEPPKPPKPPTKNETTSEKNTQTTTDQPKDSIPKEPTISTSGETKSSVETVIPVVAATPVDPAKPVIPPTQIPPQCLKPYNPFKFEPGDEMCGKSNVLCERTTATAASKRKSARPEFPDKVRMGFIPEEWFQFFYTKTGVTGPYVFGLGFFTYLISKEIYVMEHEYYSGLSMAILVVSVVKKLGPKTAAFADKLIDKHELAWEDMHKSDIKNMYQQIEKEKLEQKRAEGALMLIEAKRYMIHMQLEAAYREKIMEVYNEVIQRLEYQVACANLVHRYNHKHMMFWLHDQVMKAIAHGKDDKDQEKTKADLSAMVIRINDIEKAAQIRASSSFNIKK